MKSSDVDDTLVVAHQLLVARDVVAPLADSDDEVRRWLDWELASLIEGHFHRRVDVGRLAAAERLHWERRGAPDGPSSERSKSCDSKGRGG